MVPPSQRVTHYAVEPRNGPACGSTRGGGWPKLTDNPRSVTCKACWRIAWGVRKKNPAVRGFPRTTVEQTVDGRWMILIDGFQWGPSGPRDLSGASSKTWPTKKAAVAALRSDPESRERNPSRPSTKARREAWRGVEGPKQWQSRITERMGVSWPEDEETRRQAERMMTRPPDRRLPVGLFPDKFSKWEVAKAHIEEARRVRKPRLPNISSRARGVVIAYLLEHGWTIVGKHVFYAYVPGRDVKHATVRYRIDKDVQGQERLRRGWVNIEKMSLDAALAKLGGR